MAEGRAAIALLAASLAGAVAAAEGDGRGAVEPQAVTISVATSAKTANAQPDVSPGSHDRTSGLYAMRIAPGDGSARCGVQLAGCSRPPACRTIRASCERAPT